MSDLRERLEELARWHEIEKDAVSSDPEYFHHKKSAATLREVLDAPERLMGEPVAWVYVTYAGDETVTRQPPDRVINVEKFGVTPLYAAKPVKP